MSRKRLPSASPKAYVSELDVRVITVPRYQVGFYVEPDKGDRSILLRIVVVPVNSKRSPSACMSVLQASQEILLKFRNATKQQDCRKRAEILDTPDAWKKESFDAEEYLLYTLHQPFTVRVEIPTRFLSSLPSKKNPSRSRYRATNTVLDSALDLTVAEAWNRRIDYLKRKHVDGINSALSGWRDIPLSIWDHFPPMETNTRFNSVEVSCDYLS